MTLSEWFALNKHITLITQDLTDDFVQLCAKEPNNTMLKLAHIAGLPNGVNPADKRILHIFSVKEI